MQVPVPRTRSHQVQEPVSRTRSHLLEPGLVFQTGCHLLEPGLVYYQRILLLQVLEQEYLHQSHPVLVRALRLQKKCHRGLEPPQTLALQVPRVLQTLVLGR